MHARKKVSKKHCQSRHNYQCLIHELKKNTFLSHSMEAKNIVFVRSNNFKDGIHLPAKDDILDDNLFPKS